MSSHTDTSTLLRRALHQAASKVPPPTEPPTQLSQGETLWRRVADELRAVLRLTEEAEKHS